MHISLAIATIGRTKELTRLLESLCMQSYKDFEVLIADQNAQGFLDDIIDPFKNRLSITCIAIHPKGVSAARNALCNHIQGDIVAFPDDDCWYAPDTLEQVVAFFSKHEHVGSVMGVWSDCTEHLQLKSTIAHPLNKHSLFKSGETYVQFFRRKITDIVGMFDEMLGPGTGLPYGCGEDTDYILRAAKIAEVWRVPLVQVFHALPDTQKPNKEKIYAYAYGRMYLLRKHNFPLWFKLANVFYPLCKLFNEGLPNLNYRWHMFMGRICGLLKKPRFHP